VKHLSSKDNPTYKQLLALATQSRERRQQAQTLLDGEHLLSAALEAQLTPRLLVFSETCPETLSTNWCNRLPDVHAVTLPQHLFKHLSPVDSPSGLLAVVDIPTLDETPAGSGLLLLEDIQDPGNLGALFRVAAAAGHYRVCLSAGCAEAWSPKCLRGGQGGHFHLAIQESVDLFAVAKSWPGPMYAGALGAPMSLYSLDLSSPAAFAFGNEGAGLSAGLQGVCTPFSIPMTGQVESLNVATAAAVCLFEARRQQSQAYIS